MTIKKLSAMPYANARVRIYSNGKIELVSYETVAAVINPDNVLWVNGLYSATTRKHLGAFAREYITFPNGTHGDYQFMKTVYELGLSHGFNLETGEIVPF